MRAALLGVALATLLGSQPLGAQTSPAASLGGYTGSAAASGLHVLYNPEGVLPLPAPVDLGAPDALATIASGPLTFARASAADPGDIVANPDALLQLGAGSSWEAGTIPPYPYRVTATNGVGEPTNEVTPAPGLNARASADDTGSTAESTMPYFEAPAILTAGSATSTAVTTTDGATVTVHATSSIGDLDLLGILTIDSIVTDVTASADGTTTTVTGGTVVTGAELLGTPVEIDSSGIDGADALTRGLAAIGVHVSLPGPVEQGDGDTVGRLTAAGLRLDFELSERTLPLLGDVLDLIPPLEPVAPGAPSGDDVIALARARHLVSVHVAGASVALSARPAPPPFVPTPPPALTPPTPTPPVAVPEAPVVAGSGAVPSAAPAPAALTPGTPVGTTAGVPRAGLAEGIGGVALLALVLQPLVGDRLSRWAALLTSTGPADSCPREGT